MKHVAGIPMDCKKWFLCFGCVPPPDSSLITFFLTWTLEFFLIQILCSLMIFRLEMSHCFEGISNHTSIVHLPVEFQYFLHVSGAEWSPEVDEPVSSDGSGSSGEHLQCCWEYSILWSPRSGSQRWSDADEPDQDEEHGRRRLHWINQVSMIIFFNYFNLCHQVDLSEAPATDNSCRSRHYQCNLWLQSLVCKYNF